MSVVLGVQRGLLAALGFLGRGQRAGRKCHQPQARGPVGRVGAANGAVVDLGLYQPAVRVGRTGRAQGHQQSVDTGRAGSGSVLDRDLHTARGAGSLCRACGRRSETDGQATHRLGAGLGGLRGEFRGGGRGPGDGRRLPRSGRLGSPLQARRQEISAVDRLCLGNGRGTRHLGGNGPGGCGE